jgi:hypothetical protein
VEHLRWFGHLNTAVWNCKNTQIFTQIRELKTPALSLSDTRLRSSQSPPNALIPQTPEKLCATTSEDTLKSGGY